MRAEETAEHIVEREAHKVEASRALESARRGEFKTESTVTPDSARSPLTLGVLFRCLERYGLHPEEIDTTYGELVELVGEEQKTLLSRPESEKIRGGAEFKAYLQVLVASGALEERYRFFRGRDQAARDAADGIS